MQDTRFLEQVAITGRVLGSLFYFAPDSENNTDIVAILQEPTWHEEWPFDLPSLTTISQFFQSSIHDEEPLNEAWQRLFIGPYALPAPPWGSVWLDKENIIFGDSTVELRQWMRTKGIEPVTTQKEPEDHIGLVLMLAAWLAEQNRRDDLEELLAWHLLPWSEHFLDTLADTADSAFYIAVAKLTKETLAGYQQQITQPVLAKTVYYKENAE
ncbi:MULTISPECIES: Tat proofreading chaperone DmsD [Providencia]|uniref:Tat proofreading chaperone DmsD n=2 Tax=Providencia TaxID=586 RepID=A0AA42K194_9GAMM|nr:MULTISPECIES: Tat proofreading chaperone DmsD [Providencia]APC13632.1 Tat proofreading chaperone DmsD [Providencia rettgeri]AVL76092.1 Tat proofreading chaperone DmsD [Providencia rettgeri]EIL1984746.1 Tat proofreading chaperone DmsD [Providencia rettgeri]EIU9517107.1 Tat proofreading chaperone DmsD [Providencia rettgeri]EJD6042106.1 Tat proofreading chaperone DmsD [Providencia rettgeri]